MVDPIGVKDQSFVQDTSHRESGPAKLDNQSEKNLAKVIGQLKTKIGKTKSSSMKNTPPRGRRGAPKQVKTHQETIKGKLSQIKARGRQMTEIKSPFLGRCLGLLRTTFSVLADPVAQMVDGIKKLGGTEKYQKLDATEEKMLHNEAKISSIAYNGISSENKLPEGYKRISANDLPKELLKFFDEGTGLLELGKGLKAAIVKDKENNLIIAFAGTELTTKGRNKTTIRADLKQVAGFRSGMYSRAVGVVKMILEHNTAKVKVTGHSLGGGLAQYAVTANIKDNADRLSCSTFNTAGLSLTSCLRLGKERIKVANSKIHNIRIRLDYISPSSPFSPKGIPLGSTSNLDPPLTRVTKVKSGSEESKLHWDPHGLQTMIQALSDY